MSANNEFTQRSLKILETPVRRLKKRIEIKRSHSWTESVGCIRKGKGRVKKASSSANLSSVKGRLHYPCMDGTETFRHRKFLTRQKAIFVLSFKHGSQQRLPAILIGSECFLVAKRVVLRAHLFHYIELRRQIAVNCHSLRKSGRGFRSFRSMIFRSKSIGASGLIILPNQERNDRFEEKTLK